MLVLLDHEDPCMIHVIHRWSPWIIITLLLVLFFYFGAMFVFNTRIFNAPDERAHFYYVRMIGDSGTLPRLSEDKVTWESHQPPLYYWMCQPVYLLVKHYSGLTPVYVLRVFSLVLSGVVIVITYRFVSLLFPHNPVVSSLAAALVALNPQFIFMSGTVNNDCLTNILGALCLWLIVRSIMKTEWRWVDVAINSLAVTAAFLTKTVLWPIVLVLFIITVWQVGKKRWMVSFSMFVPLYGAMIWWLARTYQLYHSLTGFSYFKQLWYADQHKDLLHVDRLIVWTRLLFQGFWARFGYFNITIDNRYYHLLMLVTAIGSVGFIIFLLKRFSKMNGRRKATFSILILLAMIIFAGIFTYSLSFFQPQGRYLFPIISLIAMVLAVGFVALMPKRLQWVMFAGIVVLLLLVNWHSLMQIQLKG